MKKFKTLSCILVLVLFSFALSGCGTMTADKLEKLPADYTLEQAQKDGMIYVPSDGIVDEKIPEINDFFETYDKRTSDSNKYLFLIDENRIVTVFIAGKTYVTRYEYSIPEQVVYSGTSYLVNVGVRETDGGLQELYLYNTEEDDSFISGEGERIVYCYKE